MLLEDELKVDIAQFTAIPRNIKGTNTLKTNGTSHLQLRTVPLGMLGDSFTSWE